MTESQEDRRKEIERARALAQQELQMTCDRRRRRELEAAVARAEAELARRQERDDRR